MIKKKKNLYKQSIIDEMHLTKSSNIKQYWKLLKKLDLENCRSHNPVTDISPNEWVSHFTNLLQTVNEHRIPVNTSESGPLDYEITLEEMMKSTSILKPGKATGIDTLNNEMIREALKSVPSSILECHEYSSEGREGCFKLAHLALGTNSQKRCAR
jgi:hypothetical protein